MKKLLEGNKRYFVTAIDTDAGKTMVSAILCQYLKADYWKPVQSGDLDNSDSHKIERLTYRKETTIHPETYQLNIPASPHFSAEEDGVEIKLETFKLPTQEQPLIVEGAGGLLVPLNNEQTLFDLMIQLKLPVILVIRHYLGSINHSLLSIEHLKKSGLEIAAVIINGRPTPSSTSIIQNYQPDLNYYQLPEFPSFTKESIKAYLNKEHGLA